MRIVLDTNVLISAYLYGGVPRQILEQGRTGKIDILTSKQTEREFVRVLSYEKFALSAQEILPIINDFRTIAEEIIITSTARLIEEDVSDNLFLNLALDGEANLIISGDKHLKGLGKYGKIRIIDTGTFRDEFGDLFEK